MRVLFAVFVSTTSIATAQTVASPDSSQFRSDFSGRSENLPIKNSVEDTRAARIAWFGHAVQHILIGEYEGKADSAVAGIKEPSSR